MRTRSCWTGLSAILMWATIATGARITVSAKVPEFWRDHAVIVGEVLNDFSLNDRGWARETPTPLKLKIKAVIATNRLLPTEQEVVLRGGGMVTPKLSRKKGELVIICIFYGDQGYGRGWGLSPDDIDLFPGGGANETIDGLEDPKLKMMLDKIQAEQATAFGWKIDAASSSSR